MTSSLSLRAAAVVLLSLPAYNHLSAQAGQSQPPPKPTPIGEGFGQGAYRPQPGISDAIAVRRVEPRYTADARRTNIEGEVELEAVIDASGTVAAARVVKSLDATFGLDEEAIRAARQWLFRPAMYNGKPVPMVVRLVLEFRQYGRPRPLVTPAAPSAPPGQQPVSPYWIPDAEFLKGVAIVGQPNVTMPVPDRTVTPKYTADAMRAKISGTVTVDMVVGPDGNVVRSRMVRSLDPVLGLDRTAVEAASLWRFKPGLVNGQPAHVLVTVTMEFRLH